MVDALDSKSSDSNIMRVRVPPPAPWFDKLSIFGEITRQSAESCFMELYYGNPRVGYTKTVFFSVTVETINKRQLCIC